MRLRNVTAADYPPLIAVVDCWWDGRRMADALPKLFFVHFADTSFVAEEDGQRIGFLVGFLSPKMADEAYIHFVAVHPDYRKAGVARALYERFFELSRGAGRLRARCVTSVVNTHSIAFHRAMGFAIVGNAAEHGDVSFHRDYDGPGEDRVLFVKELCNMLQSSGQLPDA